MPARFAQDGYRRNMGTVINLRPEQKVGEKDNLNRHWRELFLDTLAETSNVSEAARFSEVSTSRAYKTKKLDAEFRKQWNAALLEGYEQLELETLQRLRFGTGKDDNKFDIANAIRLLMHHRENVAKLQAVREHRDEGEVLEQLGAKIKAMKAREAEVRQMLIEDGSLPAPNHGRD